MRVGAKGQTTMLDGQAKGLKTDSHESQDQRFARLANDLTHCSRPPTLKLHQLLHLDWELADPFAGCGKDGVSYGGGY